MAIIKSKKNSKASKLNKKKTMKRNSKKNVSRKMRGGANPAANLAAIAAAAMTKQAVVSQAVAPAPMVPLTYQRQKTPTSQADALAVTAAHYAKPRSGPSKGMVNRFAKSKVPRKIRP